MASVAYGAEPEEDVTAEVASVVRAAHGGALLTLYVFTPDSTELYDL